MEAAAAAAAPAHLLHQPLLFARSLPLGLPSGLRPGGLARWLRGNRAFGRSLRFVFACAKAASGLQRVFFRRRLIALPAPGVELAGGTVGMDYKRMILPLLFVISQGAQHAGKLSSPLGF